MLASLLFRWHYRRFLAACETPLAAQAARLREILRRSSDTAIGRSADFAGLARTKDPAALIREFQRRVPVRTYRTMQSDLDAVYGGTWQRLCPSRPLFFGMTAGSTGKFKFVPITEELRREVGRGALIFNGALEANVPALRGLKCQFLVGSAEGGVGPAGTPQGFMSGFNYKNLPRVVRGRFVLPYWIFTLYQAEDRSYAAGRILVSDRRLGALCAISPVNLINLIQALEDNAERLCSDIESGSLTIKGTAAVGGAWRDKPNPGLAQALRTARNEGGRFPPSLLFPSLEVLVCWQGGNMGYYRRELRDRFGLDRQFEFPISASEGVFAIPTRPNQAGGVLAVTTHFLEFLPESGPKATAGVALRADQLEIGATYRILLTTSGGLYRYDIEDLVRVTGMERRTPTIEFIAKAGRQVSVANERLTEFDVTAAMQAASEATGLWVDDFLFVPCSDQRYRVLIEAVNQEPLVRPEHEERLRGFAAALEGRLRAAAKGYDFERDDCLLEPLLLIIVSAGELAARTARRHAKDTLPNAQIKPVHLTNEFNAHTSFTIVGTYAA